MKTNTQEAPLILFKDVSVAYGQVSAIENINVGIEAGEYTCLVGGNGSGKSTFIKAAMGLISPTRGTILRTITKDLIAYLPQSTLAEKNFPATVWEIVLAGTQKAARKLPFYSRDDRAQAIEALEILGIDDLAKKRIGDLSGGQLQRVFLARALARKPQLLMFDEPVSALDPAISKKVYELIAKLNRDSGITVVMASHDIESVETYAHRVLEFDRSIIFDGTAERWHETHNERTTNHVLL